MEYSSTLMAIALAVLLSACGQLEAGPSLGKTRMECQDRGRHPTGNEDGPDEEEPAIVFDTTLMFTAVRFPDSYDWRRDSLYGSVSYEVILYKNSEQVLRISPASASCISPAHDTHHIIGGHLYTECSGSDYTAIGRDGEEIFRFNGREFLKGLLPDGNDVYTLSQKRSGEGFSLRKNGEILFSRNGGIIFGDMGDPSYGENGALYSDGGRHCFCYRSGSSGDASYYMVRNGKEDKIEADGEIYQDVKIYGDSLYLVRQQILGYNVSDGRIWPDNGAGHSVSGWFSGRNGASRFSGVMPYGKAGLISKVSMREASIYHGRESEYAVSADDGTVYIERYPDSGEIRIPGYWFMSPACASLAGDLFCAALEPEDAEGHPVIVKQGKETEIPIHGYISRVSVTISQSR